MNPFKIVWVKISIDLISIDYLEIHTKRIQCNLIHRLTQERINKCANYTLKRVKKNVLRDYLIHAIIEFKLIKLLKFT